MNTRCVFGLVIATTLASAAQAQWVTYVDETVQRMPTGPGLNTPDTSTADTQEKDYGWGDVDQDGDIDLICVRKQPWTSSGRRTNVLFMNEGIAEGHSINGVLVDRTAVYATASDAPPWDDPQVPGGVLPDQGFLTPTNDRDLVLVDVNNDTWLDIVTATTMSDNAPNHIGHPRVYVNLGEVEGVWQGFKYEMARIPFMGSPSFPDAQPRFCGVCAGDVTGDGYVDLHFADYDSSGAGGGGDGEYDYNNKLLINQGAENPGFFIDSQTTLMSASPGLLSAMGIGGAIIDMNNDGALDVVKLTALNAPLHIAIQHNHPKNLGFFADSTYKPVYQLAGYDVSAGDLNDDGKIDLIVTDDNADRYLLNTGNAADGTAQFSMHLFSLQSGGDDGFGGESVIADLNNDGHPDVLISDVDADIGGCTRRTHIYRNLGNTPTVTLQEQSPPVIPNAMLKGTHHIACFDINNDGWQDLVFGRCDGTQVWMNTPPSGLAFSYPDGLPELIAPDEAFAFQVQLSAFGTGTPVADSGKIFISQSGGPFVEFAMTSLGGNLYEATLPATACPGSIRFYVGGQLSSGAAFTDPPDAPAEWHRATVAAGLQTALDEGFEADVSAWSVVNDPNLTSGGWEAADPLGTINAGVIASPEDDAGAGQDVKAFVTQNGVAGGGPNAADVDGGPTHLVSPRIDLLGTDAIISFARWFYSSGGIDALETWVSNDDGQSWTQVDSIAETNDGMNTTWEVTAFVVGDVVTPTSQVRVRFTVSDVDAPSIVEAGLDNFVVDEMLCVSCPADVVPPAGDGEVDIDDLFGLVGAWESNDPHFDIAPPGGNGVIDIDDLFALINAWGSCP